MANGRPPQLRTRLAPMVTSWSIHPSAERLTYPPIHLTERLSLRCPAKSGRMGRYSLGAHGFARSAAMALPCKSMTPVRNVESWVVILPADAPAPFHFALMVDQNSIIRA